MKRLNPVDACFLHMESIETPMHVGAMMIFRLPAQAGPDYMSQLVARLRGYPVARPPFNHVLDHSGWFGRLLPSWKVQQHVDLDFHLRHSALPRPGGERELGVLISRLHSNPLDLSRPPWECHIIEGLENNRFAIYFKGHHGAVDGMNGLRILRSWLSDDVRAIDQPPPWAMAQQATVRPPHESALDPLQLMLGNARKQLRAIPEVYHGLKRAAQDYPNGGIGALFKAPHSILNRNISSQRRLATQSLRIARLKAIADQTETSVNDVALALCGSALRRYLLELQALPSSSLVSLVPVALRPKRGQEFGNSLCGILTDLETTVADPVERLHAISRSTRAGKHHMQSMSRAALTQYSMLMMAPLTLGQVTRAATRLPPLFNLVVSSVIVSKHAMYYNGAELENLYPVSVLFRGQALNITLLGYGDNISVSFTACRDSVPSVQRIAVYVGEALVELEQALGLMDTSALRVVSIHSSAQAAARRRKTIEGV